MPLPTMPDFPAVPGGGLPADPRDAEFAAMAAYPIAPYGMGECKTFLDVPPILHLENGSTCMNPDFAAIKRFAISAKGRDPLEPPDRNLVIDPVVPVGQSVAMEITAQRQENGLGHTLVNELMMFTDPPEAINSLSVVIKNQQGDRVYMNAPVPAVNIFGNAQLACCLPCPIMIYPNQALVVTVFNRSDPPVDVRVRIVARGKQFLPYHNMALAAQVEQCWGSMQTTPFWLQLDGELGEVAIAAGGTARAQSTIPGAGFFESLYPRVQFSPDTGSPLTAEEIEVEATYGRIGTRAMDGPISLGAHFATQSLTVAGLLGNTYAAAQACNCPPPPQLFRGNTRIIHDFTNTNDTVGASGVIRLTYVGCMHYVSRCPPQADLDLVRRYGHGDVQAIKAAQARGDRVFMNFLNDNPLYAEEEDCYTAHEAAVAQQKSAQAAPPSASPSGQPRIVSMHRPPGQYTGPGSVNALPPYYSWGIDDTGKTHLVVRNPQTNAFLRVASRQETAPFQEWLDQINQQAGMSGLGSMGSMGGGRPGNGDWGRI